MGKYRANAKYALGADGNRIFDGQRLALLGDANPFVWLFHGEQIIFSADRNYCMSIHDGDGKMGRGSNVVLWSCSQHNEHERHQWTIAGDHISPTSNPDQCLSTRQGMFQDGVETILWDCDDDDKGQKWMVANERIRSKASPDKCVSVREGRTGDGADLIVWTCDERDESDDEL